MLYLWNFGIRLLVIEALTPLDLTSPIKMYKNNARSRLFSTIAKRSISQMQSKAHGKLNLFSEKCVDAGGEKAACQKRAKIGQCLKYPDWMNKNCRKSCGNCLGNAACNTNRNFIPIKQYNLPL